MNPSKPQKRLSEMGKALLICFVFWVFVVLFILIATHHKP